MNEFQLYSRLSDHETILELWASSTHHPDVRFYFSDFNTTSLVPKKDQVFPWILECASKLTYPSHSYKLTSWAINLYSAR